MIGLFKKKEQNVKIDLLNSFNWIKNLDKQKLELSNQDIEKRLSQSKLVSITNGTNYNTWDKCHTNQRLG